MKERIRKAIKKEASLKEQLDLIDGAYITTFDSFSLSIVKKYHYLLNISKDVSIVDNSIIYNEKVKILEDIVTRLYKEKNPDFVKMINDFCVKDDDDIKKYIIKINDKMDLLMDKESFLNSYIDTYYDDKFIDEKIEEYMKRIALKYDCVKENGADLLSLAEGKFAEKVLPFVERANNSHTYEEMREVINIKLPTLSPNSSDEIKRAKEKLSSIIDDLKIYMEFENVDQIKKTFLETIGYSRIIVSIIKELDERLMNFKKNSNTYEFNDIAHMAIQVVRDNKTVREYLKGYFKEIMIDEYQDTSNIQETFINLIANDDVYMVGDIKQSIYRFRNADPYIFKNKYDNYSLGMNGIKIDLLKNFRSRDEVLNNINLIFDVIMDDEIGGAKYQESHRMVFGNYSYTNEGKTEQNYDMEVYNYTFDRSRGFTKDEIEIFTIVKDIKEKMDSNYQIFDKDAKNLRPITYNDFCILLDRSSKFDLYKKIFEYFGIPLTKYTSTNIKKDDDIYLIKNILSLLISVKNNDFGSDFKYSFMSVGRSYLFRYSDEELFDHLMLNTYEESDLFKILLNINSDISHLSLAKIIERVVDEFNFYLKSVTVGDMEKVNIRIEYIINLALGMEKMGYGISEFRDYLDNLIESDQKMECEISENIQDSVKIMTIHKSKGLEYHICYFAGFDYDFNLSDMNDRFLFSEKYGIICPYFDEGIGDTFYKIMFRDDYLKDEISEKIRLFYVALTRCKEKMILVCDLKDEDDEIGDVVSSQIRNKYKSFRDIVNSISSLLQPYVKEIELDNLGLTHDYNLIKKTNYQDKIIESDDRVNSVELKIDNEEVVNKHFSKTSDALIDEKTREKEEFGTHMHYIFEMFDFKNPDFSIIPESYQQYLKNFLHSGIDFSGNIYKEYEFIYESDNVINHGIIDLMIEYDDKIVIIDYKLKNIDDENYLKQLNGYRDFIRYKTKKEVSIYLYSIIDNKLKELNNNL